MPAACSSDGCRGPQSGLICAAVRVGWDSMPQRGVEDGREVLWMAREARSRAVPLEVKVVVRRVAWMAVAQV